MRYRAVWIWTVASLTLTGSWPSRPCWMGLGTLPKGRSKCRLYVKYAFGVGCYPLNCVEIND